VFEYWVLRKIFGLKRELVMGSWREVHIEECQLYASPDIIMVIKSRRIRWMGHIACLEEMRNAYKILVVKPDERNDFHDLGMDGKIILE
jgi:hypothetical protein